MSLLSLVVSYGERKDYGYEQRYATFLGVEIKTTDYILFPPSKLKMIQKSPQFVTGKLWTFFIRHNSTVIDLKVTFSSL